MTFYLFVLIAYIVVGYSMGEWIVYSNKGRRFYDYTPKEDRKYTYILTGIAYVVFMVIYVGINGTLTVP